MKKKRIKKLFLNFIVLIYGVYWQNSEQHLYEFNKTVITLASSALVLSFSVIQLMHAEIGHSKGVLGLSWAALVLSIIIGVVLHFLRFITAISIEKVREKEKRLTITKENFFDNKEVVTYASLISLSFILGLIQLILFTAGILLLMVTAFNSI